jgi:hypothetical protein
VRAVGLHHDDDPPGQQRYDVDDATHDHDSGGHEHDRPRDDLSSLRSRLPPAKPGG